MKVSGKVVVVTGAGSGMGRELSLELARRGATVAAVDFREETLAETAALVKMSGGIISTHTLDVSDLTKVAALPAAVIKAHGTVDAVINNAGIIQPFVPVADLPWKDVEKVMAVNWRSSLPGAGQRSPPSISAPRLSPRLLRWSKRLVARCRPTPSMSPI